MNKKFLSSVLLIFSFFTLNAQTSSNISQFIKGNISEKTTAVRTASGEEAIWLSNQAIKFSLENKELLGNDRDLDTLAVAAIISISPDVVENYNDDQKNSLCDDLISLFDTYNKSSTVQISVLAKVISLRTIIPTEKIVISLNEYLKSLNISNADSSVFKATINCLESIGNSDSFLILYTFLNNQKYSSYYSEIEKSVSNMSPNFMDEILALIQNAESNQLSNLFNLVKNNSKISKNNLCEISEKVLNKSILLMDNFSKISAGELEVQQDALQILCENKWTRASSVSISYFLLARKQYVSGLINEVQLKNVISALSNVAPIDAVTPLTAYLEELNGQTEKGVKVSNEIILSVINTLGAIGDKSAFDSLLAVTYLNYNESVLSAARDALSGLRW